MVPARQDLSIYGHYQLPLLTPPPPPSTLQSSNPLPHSPAQPITIDRQPTWPAGADGSRRHVIAVELGLTVLLNVCCCFSLAGPLAAAGESERQAVTTGRERGTQRARAEAVDGADGRQGGYTQQ